MTAFCCQGCYCAEAGFTMAVGQRARVTGYLQQCIKICWMTAWASISIRWSAVTGGFMLLGAVTMSGWLDFGEWSQCQIRPNKEALHPLHFSNHNTLISSRHASWGWAIRASAEFHPCLVHWQHPSLFNAFQHKAKHGNLKIWCKLFFPNTG